MDSYESVKWFSVSYSRQNMLKNYEVYTNRNRTWTRLQYGTAISQQLSGEIVCVVMFQELFS